MSDHRHHNASSTHHVSFDSPEMAARAELEAEVLSDLLSKATSVLAEQCALYGVEVARVLDIGCGPGVGTCCLAEQFDSARVVAVDGSATMLQNVAARAERLGLAPRVETRQVELPDGFETLGQADVAWASLVIHHLGDETAALGRIRGLLEPGGLLAVVERADPMRVLSDSIDLGRPGIWDRFDAAWQAWFSDMRADLPGATTSGEYPAMLDAAGFELVIDEALTIVVDAPLDDQGRRFAHQHLQQTRTQLEHHADAADLAALAVLIDEHSDQSVLHRGDVSLRATRHLYVARNTP